MNRKLFYILLVVLSGYGTIISAMSSINGHAEGSLLLFFNMGGEFVSAFLFMLFSNFGSPNPNLLNVYLGFVYVVGNLIAWSPLAFLISLIPFKRILFLFK